MTPQLNRKVFVASLIELINSAIGHDLLDDAANLLAGVRVLRPRLLELDILEGWIAIKREHYVEGIQVLRNLEGSPTQWSMGKAMMAMCQYYLKDPDWQISANEVLMGDATPEAVAMVRQVQRKGKAEETDATDPSLADAVPALSAVTSMQYVGYVHMRA